MPDDASHFDSHLQIGPRSGGIGARSAKCEACDYHCAAGQYHTACGGSDAGACVSCPAGQFKAAGAAQQCSSCAVGKYTDAGGAAACQGIVGFLTVDAPCCESCAYFFRL